MPRSKDVRHLEVVAESRKLVVTFDVPFGGQPADTCVQMLRDGMAPLLNSLSEIHPDITVKVAETSRYREASR